MGYSKKDIFLVSISFFLIVLYSFNIIGSTYTTIEIFHLNSSIQKDVWSGTNNYGLDINEILSITYMNDNNFCENKNAYEIRGSTTSSLTKNYFTFGVDYDASKNYCEICGGHDWEIAGEANVGAYEDSTTTYECCGDDTFEEYITHTYNSALDQPNTPFSASYERCCTHSSDCVVNNICYSDEHALTSSDVSDVFYSGYCDDSIWYGADYSPTACYAITQEHLPNSQDRWLKAGETLVGDYSDTTSNECCGDDTSEFLIYFKNLSDFYLADYSPYNETRCCNVAEDCVYNGVCYPSNTDSSDEDLIGELYYNKTACIGNEWAGGDESETYCNQILESGFWMDSGEGLAHGNYTSKDDSSCCGDDFDEYDISSSVYSNDVDFLDINEPICCDKDTDCVGANYSGDDTCFDNNSFAYFQDSDSINYNYYCNNKIWYNPDTEENYCSLFNNSHLNTNQDFNQGDEGIAWVNKSENYDGHSNYSSSKECCGDDSEEYLFSCRTEESGANQEADCDDLGTDVQRCSNVPDQCIGSDGNSYSMGCHFTLNDSDDPSIKIMNNSFCNGSSYWFDLDSNKGQKYCNPIDAGSCALHGVLHSSDNITVAFSGINETFGDYNLSDFSNPKKECCGDDFGENPIVFRKNTDVNYFSNLPEGNSCCTKNNSCIDQDKLCRNNGTSYNGTIYANNYCNEGEWINPDSTELFCLNSVDYTSGDDTNKWLIGGDNFGDYEDTSSYGCCGDDLNEFSIDYNASYVDGITGSGQYLGSDPDNATYCCNENTDCINQSGGCMQTDQSFGLDTMNNSFCNNAIWYDADNYTAEFCNAQVIFWNESSHDGFIVTNLTSGEDSSHGSYSHFGQNGCCGDDRGEYPISLNFELQYNFSNVPEIYFYKNGDNEDLCCDAPTDCVYDGVCYNQTSVINDTFINGAITTEKPTLVCYNQTWYDADYNKTMCDIANNTLTSEDLLWVGDDDYNISTGMCVGDDKLLDDFAVNSSGNFYFSCDGENVSGDGFYDCNNEFEASTGTNTSFYTDDVNGTLLACNYSGFVYHNENELVNVEYFPQCGRVNESHYCSDEVFFELDSFWGTLIDNEDPADDCDNNCNPNPYNTSFAINFSYLSCVDENFETCNSSIMAYDHESTLFNQNRYWMCVNLSYGPFIAEVGFSQENLNQNDCIDKQLECGNLYFKVYPSDEVPALNESTKFNYTWGEDSSISEFLFHRLDNETYAWGPDINKSANDKYERIGTPPEDFDNSYFNFNLSFYEFQTQPLKNQSINVTTSDVDSASTLAVSTGFCIPPGYPSSESESCCFYDENPEIFSGIDNTVFSEGSDNNRFCLICSNETKEGEGKGVQYSREIDYKNHNGDYFYNHQNGTCEYACGADIRCDEQTPFFLNTSNYWCWDNNTLTKINPSVGCKDVCDINDDVYIISNDVFYEEDYLSWSNVSSSICGVCNETYNKRYCDSDYDGEWDGICALNASNSEWQCQQVVIAENQTTSLIETSDKFFAGCMGLDMTYLNPCDPNVSINNTFDNGENGDYLFYQVRGFCAYSNNEGSVAVCEEELICNDADSENKYNSCDICSKTNSTENYCDKDINFTNFISADYTKLQDLNNAFDKSGMCVINGTGSSICDTEDEVCFNGTVMRSSCSLCAEIDVCDFSIDVYEGYGVDGICSDQSGAWSGGIQETLCCNAWGIANYSNRTDMLDCNLSQTQEGESICEHHNGEYCDYLAGSGWNITKNLSSLGVSSNISRCDASEKQCVVCNENKGTKEAKFDVDGTLFNDRYTSISLECESGCGATSYCDDKTPFSYDETDKNWCWDGNSDSELNDGCTHICNGSILNPSGYNTSIVSSRSALGVGASEPEIIGKNQDMCGCNETNVGNFCSLSYNGSSTGACIFDNITNEGSEDYFCCEKDYVSGDYGKFYLDDLNWTEGDESCGCNYGNNGMICDINPKDGLEGDGVCVSGTCVEVTGHVLVNYNSSVDTSNFGIDIDYPFTFDNFTYNSTEYDACEGYSGYPCQTESDRVAESSAFIPDGMCAKNETDETWSCDTHPIVAMDCEESGDNMTCELGLDTTYLEAGARTRFADSCSQFTPLIDDGSKNYTEYDGFLVTSLTGFNQTGLSYQNLLGEWQNDCTTFLSYNGTIYLDSCNTGFTCDETGINADFYPDGFCTMSETDCCQGIVVSGNYSMPENNTIWADSDEYCGCDFSTVGMICDNTPINNTINSGIYDSFALGDFYPTPEGICVADACVGGLISLDCSYDGKNDFCNISADSDVKNECTPNNYQENAHGCGYINVTNTNFTDDGFVQTGTCVDTNICDEEGHIARSINPIYYAECSECPGMNYSLDSSGCACDSSVTEGNYFTNGLCVYNSTGSAMCDIENEIETESCVNSNDDLFYSSCSLCNMGNKCDNNTVDGSFDTYGICIGENSLDNNPDDSYCVDGEVCSDDGYDNSTYLLSGCSSCDITTRSESSNYTSKAFGFGGGDFCDNEAGNGEFNVEGICAATSTIPSCSQYDICDNGTHYQNDCNLCGNTDVYECDFDVLNGDKTGFVVEGICAANESGEHSDQILNCYDGINANVLICNDSEQGGFFSNAELCTMGSTCDTDVSNGEYVFEGIIVNEDGSENIATNHDDYCVAGEVCSDDGYSNTTYLASGCDLCDVTSNVNSSSPNSKSFGIGGGDFCDTDVSNGSFNPNGICVYDVISQSAFCNDTDVVDNTTHYLSGCNDEREQLSCDNKIDYTLGYVASGVCGFSQDNSNNLCCEGWSIGNITNFNDLIDCEMNFEQDDEAICAGYDGYYCDYTHDAQWNIIHNDFGTGANSKCDGSNEKCVICNVSTNTKFASFNVSDYEGDNFINTQVLCESGCGATSYCDDKIPFFNDSLNKLWCWDGNSDAEEQDGCTDVCNYSIDNGYGYNTSIVSQDSAIGTGNPSNLIGSNGDDCGCDLNNIANFCSLDYNNQVTGACMFDNNSEYFCCEADYVSGDYGKFYFDNLNWTEGDEHCGCTPELNGMICDINPNDGLIGDGICVDYACVDASENVLVNNNGTQDSSNYGNDQLYPFNFNNFSYNDNENLACDSLTGYPCQTSSSRGQESSAFVPNGMCAYDDLNEEFVCDTNPISAMDCEDNGDVIVCELGLDTVYSTAGNRTQYADSCSQFIIMNYDGTNNFASFSSENNTFFGYRQTGLSYQNPDGQWNNSNCANYLAYDGTIYRNEPIAGYSCDVDVIGDADFYPEGFVTMKDSGISQNCCLNGSVVISGNYEMSGNNTIWDDGIGDYGEVCGCDETTVGMICDNSAISNSVNSGIYDSFKLGEFYPTPEGICLSNNLCRSGLISMNCSADGINDSCNIATDGSISVEDHVILKCTSNNAENIAYGCGYVDVTNSNFTDDGFVQTGTCVDTFVCDEEGHIATDNITNRYYSDCSICPGRDSLENPNGCACDSSVLSGNYFINGLCAKNASDEFICDIEGIEENESCIDSDDKLFYSSCSLCTMGSQCDPDTTEGTFDLYGICVGNSTTNTPLDGNCVNETVCSDDGYPNATFLSSNLNDCDRFYNKSSSRFNKAISDLGGGDFCDFDTSDGSFDAIGIVTAISGGGTKCSLGEVAIQANQYIDSCALGIKGNICDDDIEENIGFVADGVCTPYDLDLNDGATCCNGWTIGNITDSNDLIDCNKTTTIEGEGICGTQGYDGYYCDYTNDADYNISKSYSDSFGPTKQTKCDESNAKCILCSYDEEAGETTGVKVAQFNNPPNLESTSKTCESGCGAESYCDDKVPFYFNETDKAWCWDGNSDETQDDGCTDVCNYSVLNPSGYNTSIVSSKNAIFNSEPSTVGVNQDMCGCDSNNVANFCSLSYNGSSTGSCIFDNITNEGSEDYFCCENDYVSGEYGVFYNNPVDWQEGDETCGCSIEQNGMICDIIPGDGLTGDGVCINTVCVNKDENVIVNINSTGFDETIYPDNYPFIFNNFTYNSNEHTACVHKGGLPCKDSDAQGFIPNGFCARESRLSSDWICDITTINAMDCEGGDNNSLCEVGLDDTYDTCGWAGFYTDSCSNFVSLNYSWGNYSDYDGTNNTLLGFKQTGICYQLGDNSWSTDCASYVSFNGTVTYRYCNAGFTCDLTGTNADYYYDGFCTLGQADSENVQACCQDVVVSGDYEMSENNTIWADGTNQNNETCGCDSATIGMICDNTPTTNSINNGIYDSFSLEQAYPTSEGICVQNNCIDGLVSLDSTYDGINDSANISTIDRETLQTGCSGNLSSNKAFSCAIINVTNSNFTDDGFLQTGTCVDTNICDQVGHVAKDDNYYYAECNSCPGIDSSINSEGCSCDSNVLGGNYFTNGICANDGSGNLDGFLCDAVNETCINSDDDLFYSSCSMCNIGNSCINDSSSGIFAPTGICLDFDGDFIPEENQCVDGEVCLDDGYNTNIDTAKNGCNLCDITSNSGSSAIGSKSDPVLGGGDFCDMSVGDGSYDNMGICAYDTNELTAKCFDGEIVDNSTHFISSCSNDLLGNTCDSNLDISFGYEKDGVCAIDSGSQSSCCTDIVIDNDSIAYTNSAFGEYDTNSICVSSCSDDYNGKPCDANLDGTFEGVCANEGGSTWICAQKEIYDTEYNSFFNNTDRVNINQGYPCMNETVITYEGFLQDGYTYFDYDDYKLSCDIQTPISCYNDSGVFRCDNECNYSNSGNMCSNDFSSFAIDERRLFEKSGLCLYDIVSSNYNCEENTEACYDESLIEPDYYNTCNSCSINSNNSGIFYSGSSCLTNSSLNDNNPFIAQGLCADNGTGNAHCYLGTGICIDNDNENYYDSCSSCGTISSCMSDSGTSFVRDGTCLLNSNEDVFCANLEMCNEIALGEYGNQYLDPLVLGDGDEYCNCNENTLGQLCSFDITGITLESDADGICAYNQTNDEYFCNPYVNSLNCSNGGCSQIEIENEITYSNCPNDAYSCMSNSNQTLFSNVGYNQDGTCLSSGICDTDEVVAYNTSNANYYDNCNFGFECDSSVLGGNYNRDGFCAMAESNDNTFCCDINEGQYVVSGEYGNNWNGLSWNSGNEECLCRIDNQGSVCDNTPDNEITGYGICTNNGASSYGCSGDLVSVNCTGLSCSMDDLNVTNQYCVDGLSCNANIGSNPNFGYVQNGTCISDSSCYTNSSGIIAFNSDNENYSSMCEAGSFCDSNVLGGNYRRDGFCAMGETQDNTLCCDATNNQLLVSGEIINPIYDDSDETCSCNTSRGAQICILDPSQELIDMDNSDGRCVNTNCCTDNTFVFGEYLNQNYDSGNEACGCDVSLNAQICNDESLTFTSFDASGRCVNTNCCTNNTFVSGEYTLDNINWTNGNESCGCRASTNAQICSENALDFNSNLLNDGSCTFNGTSSMCCVGEVASGEFNDMNNALINDNENCGCTAPGEICDIDSSNGVDWNGICLEDFSGRLYCAQMTNCSVELPVLFENSTCEDSHIARSNVSWSGLYDSIINNSNLAYSNLHNSSFTCKKNEMTFANFYNDILVNGYVNDYLGNSYLAVSSIDYICENISEKIPATISFDKDEYKSEDDVLVEVNFENSRIYDSSQIVDVAILNLSNIDLDSVELDDAYYSYSNYDDNIFNTEFNIPSGLESGDYLVKLKYMDFFSNIYYEYENITLDNDEPILNDYNPKASPNKNSFIILNMSEEVLCKYSTQDLSYESLDYTTGIYTKYPVFNLNLEPGNYDIYYICKDYAGNELTDNFSFVSQLTDVNIDITNPISSKISSDVINVVVDYDSLVNESTIKIRFDGNPWQEGYDINLNVDGNPGTYHQIEVYAENIYGFNDTKTKTMYFPPSYYDYYKPIIFNLDDGMYVNSNFSIKLFSSISIYNYNYSLDCDGTQNDASGISNESIINLEFNEDTITNCFLEVYGLDTMGSKIAYGNLSFVYDDIIDDNTITLVSTKLSDIITIENSYDANYFVIELLGTDTENKGLNYRIRSENKLIDIDTNQFLDGNYNLSVYSYDLAGNYDLDVLEVEVDNSAPEFELITNLSDYFLDSILFEYTISDQNIIDYIDLYVDNELVETINNDQADNFISYEDDGYYLLNLENYTAGLHLVEFFIYDEFNNSNREEFRFNKLSSNDFISFMTPYEDFIYYNNVQVNAFVTYLVSDVDFDVTCGSHNFNEEENIYDGINFNWNLTGCNGNNGLNYTVYDLQGRNVSSSNISINALYSSPELINYDSYMYDNIIMINLTLSNVYKLLFDSVTIKEDFILNSSNIIIPIEKENFDGNINLTLFGHDLSRNYRTIDVNKNFAQVTWNNDAKLTGLYTFEFDIIGNISSLKFYVDDEEHVLSTSQRSYDIDTTQFQDGYHEIKIVVEFEGLKSERSELFLFDNNADEFIINGLNENYVISNTTTFDIILPQNYDYIKFETNPESDVIYDYDFSDGWNITWDISSASSNTYGYYNLIFTANSSDNEMKRVFRNVYVEPVDNYEVMVNLIDYCLWNISLVN